MSVVRLHKVFKSFGSLKVLDDISLEVERGKVLVLIGRSGSGKSTLLRCINGLEKIDAGEIEVNGHKLRYSDKALRELRQDVGIVFQSYNLFPHLTVLRNIMLAPMIVKKMPKEEARAAAFAVLSQVGLEEKAESFPDELSGGQQQRVAIARSLAMKPKVMLFDEVTSALDPELQEEVLKVIENLASSGMTMILVTHEMKFAQRVADTVIFVRDGKIHESGPPQEIFNNPKTKELRQFVQTVFA